MTQRRDWHRIEMSEAPQGHGLASGDFVTFERDDGKWELRGFQSKPLVLNSFIDVRKTIEGQRAANPSRAPKAHRALKAKLLR